MQTVFCLSRFGIRNDNLAVCSPQIGVKIYSFREPSWWQPQ